MEKKRKGLGKGLAALITDRTLDLEDLAPDKKILDIEIFKISPNPHQPRIKLKNIEELMESIKEKGIIQPLLITKDKKNDYQLIAGGRRLEAAKRLGLKKVPVIVTTVQENEKLELALIENIQRENLNPIEEAKAYQRLVSNFGLKQEEVAKRVGKDRSTITNILRLLQLPEDIQGDVSRETLSMGHARTILSIHDEKQQLQLRSLILKKGLSVRQTEQIINNLKTKKSRFVSAKLLKNEDPHLVEFRNKLKNFFKTKVSIRGSLKKGVIEIEFYSTSELEHIMELLDLC